VDEQVDLTRVLARAAACISGAARIRLAEGFDARTDTRSRQLFNLHQ